jgi:hypothetical protein
METTEMTKEQVTAVEIAKSRWDITHTPYRMIGGSGAIVLPCGGTPEKPQIYLAIETDGYTHS